MLLTAVHFSKLCRPTYSYKTNALYNSVQEVIPEKVVAPVASSSSSSSREINWDEVDDLPPEWDSGIDDLLSLSTTYWEPGLGPRYIHSQGRIRGAVNCNRICAVN